MMGFVLEVSSCTQLALSEISSCHAPFSMSYTKRCLVFFFSHSLQYIEIILSTSEFNWGYRPPIEMRIVSKVSSCPQLALSEV